MAQRVLFATMVLAFVSGLTPAKEKASHSKPDQAALEKSFAETLTGATLVGNFSVVGHPSTGKDRADRYEIEKAEKIEGHRWLITSRIKYGKHDVKVPIPLEVYWAGDTPVITVSNVTVPGMGTFVARVLVFGDRYAGTWQHDKFGGHMWGMIERTRATTPAAPEKPKL
ncbi:MAG TPA: hypothetical protein VGP63_03665 [Planctomycetaceae bacterium]|jgi:hypothetical protein|nr:hypothetical protein [Planctomycetaceae bacterium]